MRFLDLWKQKGDLPENDVERSCGRILREARITNDDLKEIEGDVTPGIRIIVTYRGKVKQPPTLIAGRLRIK